MRKFRKKPVVIEATQYDGSFKSFLEIKEFCNEYIFGEPGIAIVIRTLEGDMTANIGDWIIKGISGEFYPCKHEIFLATYEQV